VSSHLDDFALPTSVQAEIDRIGYYPKILGEVLSVAVGGETVDGQLFQLETTFNDDAVRRHLTALILTKTRLISIHVDDDDGEQDEPPSAIATTEAVPLSQIMGVAISHVFQNPTAKAKRADHAVLAFT
jgi:hypothetical protein